MPIFKKLPLAATVRESLGDARAVEATALADLKASYVSGDEAAEALATAKANTARRDIARLEAILIEVDSREHAAADKARIARQGQEDASVIEAFKGQAKAAAALQVAVKGYVEAYQGLTAAGDVARNAAARNPRVRSDLAPLNAKTYTAAEIARQAAVADHLLPPGASWPTASRDPKAMRPLTAHFEALTAAILPAT